MKRATMKSMTATEPPLLEGFAADVSSVFDAPESGAWAAVCGRQLGSMREP